jgi:tyrosinase
MKRLPDNDPHSWVFQANIHGFPAGTHDPDPYWAQCQHGNWWFLPWHRAYLYHFEKIVGKYAGDPNFALPYWNYSNPRSRHLPAPFRDPNSTLYDPSRRPFVNNGLDQMHGFGVVAGLNLSMANIAFADYNPLAPSFGGPALDMPHHKNRPHGAVERVPHDLVHAFVGGKMATVELAARDPIFWLHHANVDRIWQEWLALGQGRANPANDVWLNQSFTFYDVNKQRVSITVRQVLDTRALDYQYENTGKPAPAEKRPVGRSESQRVAVMRFESMRLESRPLTVVLRNGNSVAGASLGKALQLGKGQQMQMLLEEVELHGPADTVVAVYFNLAKPPIIHDPRNPHFAGYLTFFDHAHAGDLLISAADVTPALRKLQPSPEGKDTLTVTLVRVGTGLLPVDVRSPITFKQISMHLCK